MLKELEIKALQAAKVVRNIGIVIGVPVLILIGSHLYQSIIESLEKKILLLQETQYSNALSQIKSQRELHQIELESFARRMKTLEEIGQIFDVTRERIRQIEAKALRKLRHPNRNGVLKEYIK